MTDIGGYHDRIARVNLSDGTVQYAGIDDADARKYIGGRGLGVKYVFEQGPDVDPLGAENLLAFMTGPLTGSQVTMSGRLAVCTRSPLTGTVTDSHQGGWSGARLKWAGLDGVLFEGRADTPVYAYIEDGELELRDASDLWGMGVHAARAECESRLDGEYGTNLSFMGIGPGGEHEVRYAAIINEDDRASGRGGTGCVMGNKNLKAIVIKATTDLPEPADPETFQAGVRQAMDVIQDSAVTAPNEGGLSKYGTNVLMNLSEELDGLPTRNARYPSTRTERDDDPSAPNIEADTVSGERVRETILVDEPTCHSCPVACKKEVEVSVDRNGTTEQLRAESIEYESAWALGPDAMNDDRERIALMIDRCNDLGMDTIEMGNVLSMAMEASEQGALDAELDWGDAETMIDLIEAVGRRETPLADLLAEGTARAAEELGVPELSMTVKGQAIPAYDPRAMKGMGISYATSNRGACHLRGYTPAAEILGIPEEVDPYAWKGKGELTAVFQDMHAVSDSFDICKFSAFAEGMEEYVTQFNGMTGLAYSVEELETCGERIYTLERYYNNLVGFDGDDDTLPDRFLPDTEHTVPGRGASEGEVCELDRMKAEYYDHRGWVDGVVPDDKLAALDIEVGPGTGVADRTPAHGDD